MTTSTTELGTLLRALDATSLDAASAELDGLLRLADNAADELHMLATCTADFPAADLPEMFDRAARLAGDASNALLALRRGLGR